MTIGMVIVIAATAIHLRIQYRNTHDLRLKEPIEIKEIRREIAVWKRAADSLPPFSRDIEIIRDTLIKKVKILNHKLRKMETLGTVSDEKYNLTLDDLFKNVSRLF